jgi:tetratricopeptide (TPR) repeat protein
MMSNKSKAMVCVAVLCVLIVFGCRPAGSARISSGAGHTAADIRKAELLKALDRKWENPPVHYELGQLYHAAGDWSKAEYYYNIAIGFNPAYRDAQAAIVKLQLDKGERSKGEWAANTYMTQAASSPEQTLALGAAFEKQGLDEYALKCYQDALKMAPDSHLVNRQLGYYYLSKNNKEQAKDYFVRSFQLNPNQPDVAGELGRLGVAVRIPQAEAPGSNKLNETTRPATQP